MGGKSQSHVQIRQCLSSSDAETPCVLMMLDGRLHARVRYEETVNGRWYIE